MLTQPVKIRAAQKQTKTLIEKTSVDPYCVPEFDDGCLKRGAVPDGKNFCAFTDAADEIGEHSARSELQEQIAP